MQPRLKKRKNRKELQGRKRHRLPNLKQRVSLTAYPFLFLFLSSFLLTAQDPGPFSDSEERLYNDILRLRITDPRQLPNDEDASPAILYLKNLSDAAEIFVTEDPDRYSRFEESSKERYQLIKSMDGDNPYRLFFMAEIKLHQAFLNVKFGENTSAFWQIRQAFLLSMKNAQQFPAFEANKKTLAILNIMIGSVPEKYQWMLRLFRLKGTVELGTQLLEEVENSRSIFALEAMMYNRLVDVYISGVSRTAVEDLRELISRDPSNLLARFVLGSILIKDSKGEEALLVLKEAGTLKAGYLPFYYLNYQIGNIHLQKGDYPESNYYLNLFLTRYKGHNYVKDAYYKLFLTHWLSDDRAKAEKYRTKIASKGKTLTESDKYALRRSRETALPNTRIMKIRLATDGGYYDLASRLIEESNVGDFPALRDKAEFIYRQARLHHKQDLIDECIQEYEQVLQMSAGESWYFAANSALQLGYILEEKGQTDKAAEYFRSAIRIKGHEYHGSISNKAKTALQRLRKGS